MRQDLIIGLAFSLLIHAGILGGEYLFPTHKTVVHKVKEEEKLIEFVMPPPEPPDTEDEVKDLDDTPQNVIAPPSLVDMPTVVPITAFTQAIQPPPPPGLPTDKAAITIPVIKPGTKFGQGIKDLFNINDLDQRPEPQIQPAPRYPFEMKRAGISGEVTVEFIIDYNGYVIQAQIIKSSHREFEEPVLEILHKWKFKPGRKGGRAVNTRVQQSFPFKLDNDD